MYSAIVSGWRIVVKPSFEKKQMVTDGDVCLLAKHV